MCRFGTQQLTSGLEARTMAGQIQATLPKGYPARTRNFTIAKASLALMVSAGSTVPTSAEDQQPDPSFDAVLAAQADLRAACA